ncbi:hypothetical protein [Bradyrhizobium sp. SZCCHNS1054]|uniref:hypothetical protein n=1 Tax=Bradyrhizobium sp. SZCCHNS1054 TaxID=3057301 RepID=UPI002916643D|nr:hypothetical protein [Bradyrhizobium sp. SZCCHNS1054]
MNIAVVYLARLAEGLGPLRKFARSYFDYPAGASHRLFVLYKADDWSLLDSARRIFGPIPHMELRVPDAIGVDIDAYRWAVRTISNDRVCFFNTFSEIRTNDWLAKLDDNLTRRVGVVGATASYEALPNSLELVSKVVWLCANCNIAYDRNIAHYYEDILSQHAPRWIGRSRFRKALSLLLRPGRASVERKFSDYWQSLTDRGGALEWYMQFPSFPNPHIRTNAFMLRRNDARRYLSEPVIKKQNASLFECGPRGLTSRVILDNMHPILVGADGNGYEPHSWPHTETFRLETQQNILIGDNRTEMYDSLSPKNKAVYSWMSWGIYGSARVPDDFGVAFPCTPERLILSSSAVKHDPPRAQIIHRPAPESAAPAKAAVNHRHADV